MLGGGGCEMETAISCTEYSQVAGPYGTPLVAKIQDSIASFPGPAQLFVACSTKKRGEPGIFSHMSMT